MAISNIDLRVNSQQAVRGLRQAQGASQQLTKSVGGLRQAFGFLTGGFFVFVDLTGGLNGKSTGRTGGKNYGTHQLAPQRLQESLK